MIERECILLEAMAGFEDYKPLMAMVILQFIYAGVTLSTRVVIVHGMSPRVFVVYRQAIATVVIVPLAVLTRRKESRTCLSLKSFCLIFTVALIGVTINQNIYFEGLYLASSSMGSAMANLVPAITFVMASIFGLEKIKLGSLRTVAKLSGTLLCVCGAVSMVFFKGPKLLNSEWLQPIPLLLGSSGEDWFLGCFLLFGSSCLWSIWLIMQVPVSISHPDHLSLSAWMCFFAMTQSAVVTFFLEPNPDSWRIHSFLELACCLYSGVLGSGVTFFVQSWCISRKGPLFSAMFSPLCTVIVTFSASIFFKEEIYMGSFIGAAGVIAGLYAVLWGKADDYGDSAEESIRKLHKDENKTVQIVVDDSSYTTESISKNDLEEPLLSH